jgi:phospholipase C
LSIVRRLLVGVAGGEHIGPGLIRRASGEYGVAPVHEFPDDATMDTNSPFKRHIKKIVWVMFENRSFDNLLGWLYDGDPDPDVNNIPALPQGGTTPRFHGLTDELCQTFAQPLKRKLGSTATLPIVRGVQRSWLPTNTPVLDPHEEFEYVTAQLFGPGVTPTAPALPGMRGFLQDYYDAHWEFEPEVNEALYTYDAHQAPVLNTLARSYAVSDLWFASVPSQTTPNLAFALTGSSVSHADDGDTFSTAIVDNHIHPLDGFAPGPFLGKTLWEALCDAGRGSDRDWRIYFTNRWLPGVSLTSITTQMFPGVGHALARRVTSPASSMRREMDAFFADAATGDLPAWSYLEPDLTLDLVGNLGHTGADYHPPAEIRRGEDFLRRIYEALRSSPAWDETLLVVTFDEHGGTFDHVPPPWGAIDPAPADKRERDFHFDRFGVRVPALFISPWIRERTVLRSDRDEQPFDHTSLLATLADWFGVDRTTQFGKRAAAARTIEAVIGDERRDDRPVIPPDWDGKSEAPDGPLDANKATRIARELAARANRSALEIFDEITRVCHSDSDLAAYYRNATAKS